MITNITVVCIYCGSVNFPKFDDNIYKDNYMVCNHCKLKSLLVQKIISVKIRNSE